MDTHLKEDVQAAGNGRAFGITRDRRKRKKLFAFAAQEQRTLFAKERSSCAHHPRSAERGTDTDRIRSAGRGTPHTEIK